MRMNVSNLSFIVIAFYAQYELNFWLCSVSLLLLLLVFLAKFVDPELDQGNTYIWSVDGQGSAVY